MLDSFFAYFHSLDKNHELLFTYWRLLNTSLRFLNELRQPFTAILERGKLRQQIIALCLQFPEIDIDVRGKSFRPVGSLS